MSDNCEFLGVQATRSINPLRLSEPKDSVEILGILVCATDTTEGGTVYPFRARHRLKPSRIAPKA